MDRNGLELLQGGKQPPTPEPCVLPCCAVPEKKQWVITNAAQLLQAMADGISKEELDEILSRMA